MLLISNLLEYEWIGTCYNFKSICLLYNHLVTIYFIRKA